MMKIEIIIWFRVIFFSVASITVPLIIGAFIGGMSGVEILGFLFDVSMSYKVVTIGVFF